MPHKSQASFLATYEVISPGHTTDDLYLQYFLITPLILLAKGCPQDSEESAVPVTRTPMEEGRALELTPVSEEPFTPMEFVILPAERVKTVYISYVLTDGTETPGEVSNFTF